LERLNAANLLTAVLGVRSVPREGGESVVVSVPSDSSAITRQLIHEVLDGLPYECVDVDRLPRGIVNGRTGVKDGQSWRMGTQDEVGWIQDRTPGGVAITSAIPPVFDDYATVVIPEDDAERRASESALLRLLAAQSGDRPWWLGYLETGAHDVVFDHAPKVTLYAGWRYVLVEAGPLQAGTWRDDAPWRGRLPDLIYPADRAWLVSMLWDDDWRCMGGNAALMRAVLADPELDSRSVMLEEDATPPGHAAR
jgi:hypothetical protein